MEKQFAMLVIMPGVLIVNRFSETPAYISFIRPRCAADVQIASITPRRRRRNPDPVAVQAALCVLLALHVDFWWLSKAHAEGLVPSCLLIASGQAVVPPQALSPDRVHHTQIVPVTNINLFRRRFPLPLSICIITIFVCG